MGRRSLSGSAAARHSDAEWDAERPVLGSELPSLGSRVRASSPALTEAPATGPFICAYGRMLNRWAVQKVIVRAKSSEDERAAVGDRSRLRSDRAYGRMMLWTSTISGVPGSMPSSARIG